MDDYTIVCGVDSYHLPELELVYPTWIKHKPHLLKQPMIIFCDVDQLNPGYVGSRIPHPDLKVIAWPTEKTDYGEGKTKWDNCQRYKMLSGFTHVPAMFVETKYWLKLDTDLVATCINDWIDSIWFEDSPAIVAHRWSFTKPPDQMDKLDAWVEEYKPPLLTPYPPLNLHPQPGSSRLGHKRIISFCGFFNTEFTKQCARAATMSTGPYSMPVPSQDGFHFYCAKRMGAGIVRSDMKSRGWAHWSHRTNLTKYAKLAMES